MFLKLKNIYEGNFHTAKNPYGKILYSVKFLYGKISLRRKFLHQNFLMANILYSEISLQQI